MPFQYSAAIERLISIDCVRSHLLISIVLLQRPSISAPFEVLFKLRYTDHSGVPCQNPLAHVSSS
jgi:hypothetical protein